MLKAERSKGSGSVFFFINDPEDYSAEGLYEDWEEES